MKMQQSEEMKKSFGGIIAFAVAVFVLILLGLVGFWYGNSDVGLEPSERQGENAVQGPAN
jgi:hypothetical protein